ncbi:MAG: twin-arginine translocation signal domain-containing protein [Acidimicrobiales bacterium]
MAIDRRQILTGIGAASAAGALAGPFADLAAAASSSDGAGFTTSGRSW